MMSSNIESRAIRLGKIGSLDENDLRETYKCLDTSSGENVVKDVFIPEGQDFAVVIFTDEKFVTKAMQLDHGDIEVSQPYTLVFSAVSATIHEMIPRAIGSRTLWQLVVKQLMSEYGVSIKDLVIHGSWLQVEMCMFTLRKIYNERRTCDVTMDTGKAAIGRAPETGSEEQGSGTTTTEESMSHGTAGIESDEDIFVYRGNRHGTAAPDSCHTGMPCAEAVPRRVYHIASTKVHVYVGDITRLKVDVIVNAANSSLEHGAGVAAAIARAAGPELKRECYRYIQDHGSILTGCGVMTTSGQLPCRGVFHVVGPMWYRYADKNDCLNHLELAFTNCLLATEAENCSSVAIPSISSGLFGVPGDWVAQVMYEAVTKFCHNKGRDSNLTDIHLVDINATMVTLVQENFEQSITSDSHSQRSAGITDMISGVAGKIWKGLSGATTTESVTEADHGESCSRDVPDDQKNRSSSTSGVNDAEGSKKKVDAKTASGVSPSTGHTDRLPPNAKVVRSASDRENRRDNQGTPAAKDPKMKSYAAAAQGGATNLAKKQDPDGVGREPSGTAVAKGDSTERDDECPICMDKLDHPEVLSICKHKFCKACIDRSFAFKKECPVCRMVYGKLQGTQPKDGRMQVVISYDKLPGYSCRTWVIHYTFPNGIQTQEHPHPGQMYHGARRIAYLPDNRDGQRILFLLKKAFKQRLTFTVGQSVTTGMDDCVTWNDIHHKTNQCGGPDCYGYPDEGYLQRVAEDLAAKGIK